jgi:HAD superfamily hydrolase (TIGR01549 family)
MSIRAITFDFWYTLFADSGPTVRKAMRRTALALAANVAEERADAVLEDCYAQFLAMYLKEKRTRPPEEAVEFVCRELDVTLDDTKLAALTEVFATAILADPPKAIAGALDAVQAAAKEVPIGIISDTGISPAAALRTILDRNGFTPHFSALSFSDEVGVAKPQAPIFEVTAKALGVELHEILHIGDLEPTDIVGAQALGAKAALFTGANDRYKEETQADYTFENWEAFNQALPELLGS